VYGSVNVGRAILGGLQRLVPQGLVRRTAEINGKPGIISYLDGRPYAVLTIDIVEGFIASIYIVSNPEKLERLPRLPDAPS
jgi:RNA polymerase sigma-70 factor (ECF subfamily)